MREDFDGSESNSTLTESELPAGTKAVCGEWVYRWKSNQLREIARGKSRFVAFEHQQKDDIDKS